MQLQLTAKEYIKSHKILPEKIVDLFEEDKDAPQFDCYEMQYCINLTKDNHTYIIGICGFDGTLILVKDHKLLSNVYQNSPETGTSDNDASVLSEFLRNFS